MSDASSGQTIYVRPGTYTEDFTHKAGVDIVGSIGAGYDAQTVIDGKITTPGSGS